MKVRFYIAPQQGDGTDLNPFRSILRKDFIDVKRGERFDEIDNPARRISICCVHALDETHTKIVKEVKDIIIVSPLVDGYEGLSKILDTPFIEIKDIADAKTFEGIGIDTTWIKDNTLRDFIQHIVKLFSVVQIADGEGGHEIKEFFTKDLVVTVDSVSSTISTKLTEWINEKGINTASIGDKTTVKDISKLLVDSLDIGKLKMSGEEF
jgi:hypothetical protein